MILQYIDLRLITSYRRFFIAIRFLIKNRYDIILVLLITIANSESKNGLSARIHGLPDRVHAFSDRVHGLFARLIVREATSIRKNESKKVFK